VHETIFCNLDISNPFAKWAEKIDNAEAAAREAKGIKVFYLEVAVFSP